MKMKKRRNNLRYILFTGVFLFITTALYSADAPKTIIGNLDTAIPGQPVTVPVMVTGFTNIGSFYLYLEYDYSKLQFSSLTKNPTLTGNYDINDVDLGTGFHRIILSYSGGINGKTLPDSSSIVDIVFDFIAGPAEIVLNTTRDNYCNYTDPQVNRLNDKPKSEFYTNGTVQALPQVPSTPVLDTIVQPTSEIETGSVELSGLPEGNWIINPGEIQGTGSETIISGLSPGTYNFTVTNADNYTSSPTTDVVIEEYIVTAVNDVLLNGGKDKGLSFKNYPNPFSTNTTFEYTLPFNGKVAIKIYNHLGQQVASMVNTRQTAGKYSVDRDFDGFQPGIYIARITFTSNAEKITKAIKLSVLDL